MANFLETQPLEFAKLAPAPVELYGRVGMMKQSMYDANTAKVQGYYDAIAGLDVNNEVDKAYLNEKLTQLQTDLGTLAGADFSKQSVVNQAGAMAGPLSKDPLIMQAVMSTAQMRKSDKTMEEARRKGKNFPTNDLVYSANRAKYTNSTEVGAPFNAQYVQKTVDPFKVAVEAFKAYIPGVTEQDMQQIQMLPDGTYDVSKIREKIKSVSPQKIQDILHTALDAGAIQQIQIDAQARYMSQDEGQFASTIFEHTQKSISYLASTLKTVEAKLVSASGQNRVELEEAKENLESAIKSIQDKSQDYYKLITDKNLDGAKAAFGLDQYVNRFSTVMAYTEHSRLIMDGGDGSGTKKEAKEEKKDDPYGSVTGRVDYVNVDASTIKSYLDAMGASIKMDRKSIIDKNYDVNGTKTPEERELWYDVEKERYRKGDFTGGNPAMAQHFANIDKRESKFKVVQDAYDKVIKDADASYNLGNIDISGLEDISVVRDPVKHPGVTDVYSPMVALSLQRHLLNHYGGGDDDPTFWNKLKGGVKQFFTSQEESDAFTKTLPKEEQDLINILNFRNEDMTYLESVRVVNEFNAIIESSSGKQMFKMMQDRHGYINEELKSRYGLGSSLYMNLAPTDAHLRSVKTGVAAIIGEAIRGDVGFNQTILDADTTPAEAKKIAEGDGATFSLLIVPGHGLVQDQYGVAISSKEDDKQAIVPISQDQKDRWFGPDFEYGTEGRFVKETQERMLMVKNGSTNPAGIGATPEEAIEAPYLQQTDFPNIKLFHVRGDVFTGEDPSTVNAAIYVYSPFINKSTGKAKGLTRVYLDSSRMFDYNTMSMGLKGLTDEKLYFLLEGKYPTREELEQLKTMKR